jgi:hypothetical protein
MKALRRWLVGRSMVRRALATPVPPLLLRRPPSRVVLGLALIGASYVVGWPAIAALGAIAAWLKAPQLLLGAPALYGLSWLVFAGGLALIGRGSVGAARACGLLLVRRLAERFLVDS